MRLYSLLLHIYPTSFRQEYGDEMVRLFRERYSGASPAARAGLWCEALKDLLTAAPTVHADILRHDLRHTWRSLSRTPGFTAAAIVVMALGIGATTAVFSVADRVLLRPLPFAESDRLVRIWENVPGYPQLEPSPANYRDWTAMTRGFDQLEAHMRYAVNMIRHEPERVQGIALTAGLLPMLGVQPSIGRLFTQDEGRVGGPAAVILSDRLWRRAFDADPSVLGQPLRLDEATFTVVAVMPRDFYYPDRETDLWVPMTLGPTSFADRDNNFLSVIGRLRQDATLESARAEMNGVMAVLEKAYPKENAQTRATVRLFDDQVSWQSTLLIRVMLAASGCLLLIACTNLASLLLARFSARARELTVRAALGAGHHRLTRQLLTESLALALAGGAAGVAFAFIATPLLARLVPTTLPVPDATALDARVLAFAAAVTLLTGVIFGMLPASRVSGRTRMMSLREVPRGNASGRERLRSVLVAAQIAASVLLLVCAGLLGRALATVQTVDPGFIAEGVLTLRTALPPVRYKTTAARAAFYERVVEQVEALPGISSAAYASFTPMVMPGGIWTVDVPGRTVGEADADPHTASLRYLTPGYFSTLGITLTAGRDFSASDTFESPFVAVVSESFAKRYWPNADPLGRRFTVAFHERLVVGVARDVRVRGLERVSEPQVYVPHRQIRDGFMPFYAPKDLLVKTSGDPLAILPAIRRIVREADPELPVSDVRTMNDILELETAPRETQTSVLALFAAMALLLAGIGLHGLLSFGVSQRHREIGVRLALGAPRASVVSMVVRESAALAAAGGVAGVVLAYAAGRSFESLLAGVRPADPATFGVAIGFTLLMALFGSLRPAMRAVRVDPVTALRSE